MVAQHGIERAYAGRNGKDYRQAVLKRQIRRIPRRTILLGNRRESNARAPHNRQEPSSCQVSF